MTKPDDRPQAPTVGGERDQLIGFLDFLRATVVWKCGDLTDEQARRSLVPSKLVTLAGLVSHLTLVEEWWFANVVGGEPDRWDEASTADPDVDWKQGADTPLPELVAAYQAQCEVSRRYVAERDLDDVITAPNGKQFNVRWVLLHMIEETARHAGHLDLIREMTDGLTGE
ncbi:MAG TPA: DinB family protein [Actinophytocola sp.]|jgi:uncharacterized damage-inducible protein DinB|uniref:DinB family protein n=1 Tax=Actinophytocola sp. TaxID=1872138 RepID=UPI002E0AE169|nr:DinB family protein [Actinophytocola sp.]